ncbi:MAG: Unknown, probable insecticidal toxin [uncultured Caballeronia sp.]|nr:MAG: Unknown, probable insecticidal toxin [uncultured Caballeronia sp.]
MRYAVPVDTESLFVPGNVRLIVNGKTFLPSNSTAQGMSVNFDSIEVDISDLFENGSNACVDISANISNGQSYINSHAHGTLRVSRVDLSPENILQLHSTETGAQYMQLGVHRIRLNTLLGPELVSLAATGIDAILAMRTQHLQEPQLGKGFYATFTLPAYNAAEHGTHRNFRLHLKHVVDNDAHVIYSGQFQADELIVRLFIPLDAAPLQSNFVAKVFLTTQRNPNDGSWNGPHFTEINGVFGIHTSSNISMFSDVGILSANTEPMDFSGACALYFWELFYYRR